jgi:hypothetical protein
MNTGFYIILYLIYYYEQNYFRNTMYLDNNYTNNTMYLR